MVQLRNKCIILNLSSFLLFIFYSFYLTSITYSNWILFHALLVAWCSSGLRERSENFM